MGNCREITAWRMYELFHPTESTGSCCHARNMQKTSSGFISASLVETTPRLEATFSQQGSRDPPIQGV